MNINFESVLTSCPVATSIAMKTVPEALRKPNMQLVVTFQVFNMHVHEQAKLCISWRISLYFKDKWGGIKS